MLKVGTMLRGIYRIDSYLSSGGFGNTYVATNVEFNERVAIKEFFMRGITQRDDNQTTVSVSNADNQDSFREQREKFKKEARRLRQLSNPHIVSVHDLFEENGTAYYVMDYVDGENLAERLRRTGQPMTEGEVGELLPQILSALKSVHDASFWHLDLKPANIMVDRHGQVKLIDFGASKQLNAQKGGATTSTAISYTHGYAPREQMEQNYDKFGPWTDLYALGATLYTLLTNKRPPLPTDIDDDTSSDKHLALPFPAPVSEDMKHRVLWMMSTNRMQRPQSVSAIAGSDEEATLLSSSNAADDEETIVGEAVKPQAAINERKAPKTAISDTANTPKAAKRYWRIAAIVLAAIAAIALLYKSFSPAPDDSPVITTDEAATTPTSIENMVWNSPLGDALYTGAVKPDTIEGSDKLIPHGKGVAKIMSGEYAGNVYDGEFDWGKMQGPTKYTQRNGDVFVGLFKNNQYDKGKYTIKSSGEYFEGTFKNGQPDNGDWYDKNGNKY